MDDMATYAKWLKAKRLAANMTQQQLADATGIHRTYIIRMEKPGHIDLPERETRDKVHAALGTTEDELIALGIVGATGTRHVPATIGVVKRDEGAADAFIASLTPDQRQLLRDLLDGAEKITHIEDERDDEPPEERIRKRS